MQIVDFSKFDKDLTFQVTSFRIKNYIGHIG